MNHFMLPDGSGDPSRPTSDAMRYGAYAMEVLINELIKRGARRGHMEAKVFGGGAVLKRMTTLNIGEDNAKFVRRYLALEKIPIVGEDLLGEHPRKVCYMPATGKVMVRKLALDVRVLDPRADARADLAKPSSTIGIEQRERAMAEEMASRRARHAQQSAGTVELFGKSSTQTRHAEVLARSPLASRVEMFTRPAVGKPVVKPSQAIPSSAMAANGLRVGQGKGTPPLDGVFNKVSETM
jgi:chemotaxis protein CheD